MTAKTVLHNVIAGVELFDADNGRNGNMIRNTSTAVKAMSEAWDRSGKAWDKYRKKYDHRRQATSRHSRSYR